MVWRITSSVRARRRAALVGLLVVVGAVGAILVSLPGDRDVEVSGRSPAGTTREPAATTTTTVPPTSTTRAAGAPPPITNRPLRIAWSGNSVADSLADAVVAEGAARGVEIVNRTISGCGMLRGLVADDNLAPVPFVTACDAAVPANQDAIAASHPDVVTWLSSWETANRVVDGQRFRFGTPVGDAEILSLIDESVGRLTATGARVVFLTTPPNAASPKRPTPSEADVDAMLHLDDLLREYVAGHPATTSLLDFSGLVCPVGPPCPVEVDGVVLRPVDGGHFGDAGAAWVAPRLLDLLVGAA